MWKKYSLSQFSAKYFSGVYGKIKVQKIASEKYTMLQLSKSPKKHCKQPEIPL